MNTKMKMAKVIKITTHANENGHINEITKEFDTIRKVSGKQIFSLIIHNKTMITLFVTISLLAILTVVSGIVGF